MEFASLKFQMKVQITALKGHGQIKLDFLGAPLISKIMILTSLQSNWPKRVMILLLKLYFLSAIENEVRGFWIYNNTKEHFHIM